MLFNIVVGFFIVVLYILVALAFVAIGGMLKVLDSIVDAIEHAGNAEDK